MSGKRVLLLSLVLLGLVVIAGCPQTGEGQRPISTPSAAQPQELTPAEDLKNQLSSLAELGERMPGMETMGENIEALKATDPEKGAALEKDFEELNSLRGREKIKAKAKEMLDKL